MKKPEDVCEEQFIDVKVDTTWEIEVSGNRTISRYHLKNCKEIDNAFKKWNNKFTIMVFKKLFKLLHYFVYFWITPSQRGSINKETHQPHSTQYTPTPDTTTVTPTPQISLLLAL